MRALILGAVGLCFFGSVAFLICHDGWPKLWPWQISARQAMYESLVASTPLGASEAVQQFKRDMGFVWLFYWKVGHPTRDYVDRFFRVEIDMIQTDFERYLRIKDISL